MNWLWMSLSGALGMLWATFWALVLGFTISGILQVFVSKEQMNRLFGRTTLGSVLLATGLGAASSSCSYAAVAAARSAIQQGAALIPALAFMFASTNLVIELGAVLWLLMGWQFVLAEVIGSFVLIGLVWLLVRWFLPATVEREIYENAKRHGMDDCRGHEHHHYEFATASPSADGHERDSVPPSPWSRVADAFVMDWSMLWKEILGGFLIAGFVAAVVPHGWWQVLFLQSGPTLIRLIENALVGPLIAVISFVCSVGNIPLASLLWAHGISFGGVISFIYADLIVIPLIIIYAKYYGARAAIWFVGIFYAAMVLGGLVVDFVFNAIGWVPSGPRPMSAIEHGHIVWNYTSWFDLAALVLGAWLVYLHFRSRSRSECQTTAL
jgi:uncharacterized membrane protein YraQ (UPF0718 family)